MEITLWSHQSGLEHLKWETLESRRTKSQLTMFFKINNNSVDILPDQYITAGHSRTRANHDCHFRKPTINFITFHLQFVKRPLVYIFTVKKTTE